MTTDIWRIGAGEAPALAHRDPGDLTGAPGDRKATEKATKELRRELGELQQAWWEAGERGLLVVLQAMDTGGKDGTIRKTLTRVNPAGVRVRAFGRPTEEELRHDPLWRIHPHVPAKGEVVVFNRSHYEDVLVVRVHELVPEERWRRRYGHLRDFERMLAEEGTRIVKLHLQISKDEQEQRLKAREADPAKAFKVDPNDWKERELWGSYQAAYEDAIRETSTEDAPWFVIPADHKWFRNWAVLQVLTEALRG